MAMSLRLECAAAAGAAEATSSADPPSTALRRKSLLLPETRDSVSARAPSSSTLSSVSFSAICLLSGLDEPRPLDCGRDLRRRLAGIGRMRRRNAPDDRADPAGMAGLDGDDLRCRRERRLGQVRRLPVVCGEADLLEYDGGLPELRRVARGVGEVEAGLLAGLRAERALEEGQVRLLVRTADPGELASFTSE